MNKISYALTVCQERKEVQLLIEQIQKYKREIDDILVLFDEKNGSDEVREYLEAIENITLIRANFDNDFATFKNRIFSYLPQDCTHIFFLDADEIPHHLLLSYLPDIIDGNPNVDLFWIPRINIVRGIGLSHVEKWGWNISKLDNYKEEKTFDLTENDPSGEYRLLAANGLIISEEILDKKWIKKVCFYTPIINKWDYQGRLCKNIETLRWSGSVHETIQGAEVFSKLPEEEFLSLIHDKQISKQVKQNELYSKI